MSSGVPSDREAIAAALDRLEAAHAEVASLSFDALTTPELLNVMDRLEAVYRRQPAVNHQLIHQLTTQATPVEVGGKLGSGAVNADADRPRRRPPPCPRRPWREACAARRGKARRMSADEHAPQSAMEWARQLFSYGLQPWRGTDDYDLDATPRSSTPVRREEIPHHHLARRPGAART